MHEQHVDDGVESSVEYNLDVANRIRPVRLEARDTHAAALVRCTASGWRSDA